MFKVLSTIIKVSRPKIWIYTIGPVTLGFLAAFAQGQELSFLPVLLLMLLSTIPINLFLYGINDYFDAATDAINPKKDNLEYRASLNEKRLLLWAFFSLGLFLMFIVWQTFLVQILFLIWFFLVYTYNAPPLRLKAIPILDILLAYNYPLLGVIAYVLATDKLPSVLVLIPITFLSIMFHVYSSINDIPHDKNDGVYTTAVWLGTEFRSILVCLLSVLMTAVFFIYIKWFDVAVSVIPYLIFLGLHLGKNRFTTDWLWSYKVFLILQYLVGGISGFLILKHLGL